jgi:hypothetical protein
LTGHPIGSAFAARIDELGGEDWVFGQIADGKTLQSIADQVPCSRQWLSSIWMKGPGRKDKLREARKESAPLVAEDAGDILERTAALPTEQLTPARVQIDRARADHQLKRAAFLDPETFGEKQGVSLTIDIGQLHLEALKAKGSMQLAKPELAQFGIPGPSPAALPPPTILEGKVEPDTDEAA